VPPIAPPIAFAISHVRTGKELVVGCAAMGENEAAAQALAAQLGMEGIACRVIGRRVHWQVEVGSSASRLLRVHCFWYDRALSGLVLGMNLANARSRPGPARPTYAAPCELDPAVKLIEATLGHRQFSLSSDRRPTMNTASVRLLGTTGQWPSPTIDSAWCMVRADRCGRGGSQAVHCSRSPRSPGTRSRSTSPAATRWSDYSN
jgi:hypothetical protein